MTGVHELTAIFLVLSASAYAAPGDWPMWRHDTHLTAHQPLPGAMKAAPGVLAKHFLEAAVGTPTFADLTGGGEPREVIVLARGRMSAYDADAKLL